MRSHKKHALTLTLFIILTTNCYSELHAENNWHNYLTKETVIAGTLGAVTTLLIGKKIHDIYLSYCWSNKHIIRNCRTLYKKAYSIIQYNKNMYQNDSQLSDWDLKETIYTQKSTSPYPFMAYHSSLTQSLYSLERQMNAIQIEINYLYKRKQQLLAYTMQKNVYMIEILTRLEIQGHLLEAHLYKIQSMLIMLKNRIALFKEYNDDYHNWIYEQNKKRQEKAQSS